MSMLVSSPPPSPSSPSADTDPSLRAASVTEVPPKNKSIKKRIKRIFTRTKQRRNTDPFSTRLCDKSIISLGTIDLDNNNEDFDLNDDGCGFGLYAYDDIDRFHNARCSTHSSFSLDPARGLHRSVSFNLADQLADPLMIGNDTTTVATASDVAAERMKMNEQDKVSDAVPCRNESEKQNNFLSTVTPQDINFEIELVSNRLSNLFREGKEEFKNGFYHKAWEIQTKALSLLVSSQWMDHEDQGRRDNDNDNDPLSFFARQNAMIQYELAKIKYHQAREQTNTVSAAATDTSSSYHVRLSTLHENLKNTQCNLALRNYQYYTSQLRQVEESTDRSDTNQIYNNLYILHNLGTLCEKDLHRYKEALGYYNHALRIEETVWRAYSEAELVKEKMENDANALEGDGEDGVGVSAHVKDFAQRIRGTRRKIGRLQHTCLGRFDLALFSNISS